MDCLLKMQRLGMNERKREVSDLGTGFPWLKLKGFAKPLFSAHDANPAFRAFHYSWILCRQRNLAESFTSTG